MPDPIVLETPRSREGTKQYAGAALTREFVVMYADDVDDAIALIEAAADPTFNGRERKQIAFRSLGAPDLWLFTVEYGSAAADGALKPDQFSVKLGVTTVHITQSNATLYRLLPGETPVSGTHLAADALLAAHVLPDAGAWTPSDDDIGLSVVVVDGTGWAAGVYEIVDVFGGKWVLDRTPAAAGTGNGVWHLTGSAPDCKGAIGVSLDTVQGCDIAVPSGELTYTSSLASMTEGYYRTCRALVGMTNNAPFRGFARGELLYLGFEPSSPGGSLASGRPFVYWNLAHSFKHEETVFNVKIGDIVVPRKGGHEYVWARYTPVAIAGALIPTPSAVYVEQVARGEGDFTALGISL